MMRFVQWFWPPPPPNNTVITPTKPANPFGWLLIPLGLAVAYVVVPLAGGLALGLTTLRLMWFVSLGWMLWAALLRLAHPSWGSWARALGLTCDLAPKPFLRATCGLILAQSLTLGVLALGQRLLLPSQPPPTQLWEQLNQLPVWEVYLMVAVATPLQEELAFRGWLYHLGSRLLASPVGGGIVSVAVFTLLHSQYRNHAYALLFVLSLGILLTVWRHRYGTLWPGVVAHAFNNSLAFVAYKLATSS